MKANKKYYETPEGKKKIMKWMKKYEATRKKQKSEYDRQRYLKKKLS